MSWFEEFQFQIEKILHSSSSTSRPLVYNHRYAVVGNNGNSFYNIFEVEQGSCSYVTSAIWTKRNFRDINLWGALLRIHGDDKLD